MSAVFIPHVQHSERLFQPEQQGSIVVSSERPGTGPLLQDILNAYADARESSLASHPLVNTLRELERVLRTMPALASRKDIRVQGSFGKGKWAAVPWAALLNPVETTTTQRGVYGVFLFREDMSGVYLTLNQGVTEPRKRLGKARAREELRTKAAQIRQQSPALIEAGFQLDDRIDLRATGALGRDYEQGTIAYKLYQSGQIPSDTDINRDISAVLAAYDQYVGHKSAGIKKEATRSWVFQANPDYYDLAAAVRSRSAISFEIRQHANEIRKDDRVFLWQSGSNGGIFALASIISDPQVREFPQSELPYVRDSTRFAAPFLRAELKIESSLSQPLLRRDLLSIPGLRELSILRRPQATNFRISAAESETLNELYQSALAATPRSAPKLDLAAVVASFSASLDESNLRFSLDTVRTFVASLATKRFVILTGLSGSGKTQIALRFGQWCGADRVRIIPVRPDWTGPEYLLGYEDALLPSEDGRRAWQVPEALQFMLEAAGDPQNPYVLVLDEMNLAHVERYFADVLSGMESDEPCLPHLGFDEGYWRIVSDEVLKIRFPDNLFIVGTVNVDETTFMFSPKVLDRANTIEFRIHHTDLTTSARRPKPVSSGPDDIVRGFLEIARDGDYHLSHEPPRLNEFETALRELHEILAEAGFEFGHRTFFEAVRFAGMFAAAGEPNWKTALDLQLLQKLLPRLHGARRKLEPVVKRLESYCVGLGVQGQAETPTLPKSLARLRILNRSLQANQFAGFVE